MNQNIWIMLVSLSWLNWRFLSLFYGSEAFNLSPTLATSVVSFFYFSTLENDVKISLHLRISLVSSASWLVCPKVLVLMNKGKWNNNIRSCILMIRSIYGTLSCYCFFLWKQLCLCYRDIFLWNSLWILERSFAVSINPTGLPPGHHFAEVMTLF